MFAINPFNCLGFFFSLLVLKVEQVLGYCGKKSFYFTSGCWINDGMAKDYNRQACRTLLAEKGERLKGIKMKFQNEQAREKN